MRLDGGEASPTGEDATGVGPGSRAADRSGTAVATGRPGRKVISSAASGLEESVKEQRQWGAAARRSVAGREPILAR
jgi:hypothetical protein